MRTKIVATVGPASDSEQVLCTLIEAGVDVFRLNFSHGTPEEHGRSLATIRQAAGKTGQSIAVMGDLCGPKIRVGQMPEEGVELQDGETVILQAEAVPGSARRIGVSDPELPGYVQPGAAVLINDGRVRLRAVESKGGELTCLVEVGGLVLSRKGINLPGTRVPVPPLTEKDRRDARWAAEHGLDFVALSFVRNASDITELRKLLGEHGSTARIVAKIEKPEAILGIREIIQETDVILVARGDLGVEMEITRVPLIQKEITARCLQAGTPVIVATQMLESMIASPTPTRAEASDVANAVLDSVDAVMLSGETAIGRDPARAVRTMSGILREVETHQVWKEHVVEGTPAEPRKRESQGTSSLVAGAALVAEELDARCVVIWTQKGYSAQLLSNRRMRRPIIAITEDPAVRSSLSLCYGITTLVHERPDKPRDLVRISETCLLERHLAEPGDQVLIVASARPPGPRGDGAIYVHRVSEPVD